jgi:hypothetical protein
LCFVQFIPEEVGVFIAFFVPRQLSITSVQGAVGRRTVSLVEGRQRGVPPTANFNGPAGFTYTVSDGNGSADDCDSRQ